MKKFIPLPLVYYLFLSFASPPSHSAKAEQSSSYACILSENVYLYSRENENSGLFILPYTYYVKVLSPGIEYCYVQYQTDSPPFKAIYGYCKSNEITFVDYVPTRPFLYYTIEATYRLDGYSELLSSDPVFSTVTLTYAYYGNYTVGSSAYCYVSLDGKTGYLPKTQEISYDLNPDYAQHTASLPAEQPPSEPQREESSVPVGQVVLLSVMGLLAVGVVYYLLRPRAPVPPPPEEYDV